MMKLKPPIMPKYIQTVPNVPSGMKKAPIIPPITRRYLTPQNLKVNTKKYVKIVSCRVK